jgi:two-component system LytT family sensor kinase
MKNTIKLIFKILIIGIIISAVISSWAWGFEALQGRSFTINHQLGKEFMVYMLYGVVLTIINVLFYKYFGEKIDWENHPLKKYRIALELIIGTLLTVVGVFLIRFVTVVGFQQKTFSEFIQNENSAHYYVSTFIALIITIVFHAIYFYKIVQENKVKEQKIIAGVASAQFESLKNQIDPHFLFNSLNVLTSLIDENPERAQDFTTSLSKIYRYVLEQKDKELVPVEEELDFAKTYMGLLNLRFVPLSLQLLLENCIKHNIVSEQKPLHIKIYFENAYLVVENNLQIKQTLDEHRKGVGIQNIVNRYAILTKRNVLIEESSASFKIKIPILTKQLSVMNIAEQNSNISYLEAQKRVKKIKEFYINLSCYCVVIPFLIFINLYTYSEFLWFFFPMLGWGIGLVFQAFDVFGYGKNWEEKKIKEIMQKEKTNHWE